MKYVRLRCWLAIGLAGAAVPAVASAQSAPAALTDKVKARTAKQYVDAGLAAQGTGDYLTAITFYQKAYELVPHPVLIFNIAQATRLAGKIDDALVLYAKYLALDPQGAQAQTARDIVADLQAKRAEAARATAEPSPPQVAPPAASVALPVEPPPPAPASPGRALRITGLTVGALGVVGLGVGVGFAVHGRTLERDVTRVYDPGKARAGDRANTIAYAGGIGGGVLVVAGTAMYLWGHARASERLAIAPALSPALTGLVVRGAWQ